MTPTQRILFLFTMLAVLLFSSCKEDKAPEPTYTIPTSYNFENVSYSGQTQRLAMFTELITYLKTSRTSGTSLNIDRLKAMYANDANMANWQGTYDASKQLKNKTFEFQQDAFDELLEQLAVASESTVAGTDGQAGVVASLDGSKTYLLNANGVDEGQLVEKGLMGACLYYQATSVYMGDEKMNVDNETVEPGTGTTMEHHWDEAFGYFGVPINFPTDLDGLVFWGSYSNQRDAILGSNKLVMDALLKGRAAISNNDLPTRDIAITEARQNWELIAVGSALHYLNTTVANFDDMALRGHFGSEALGFIYSLQFNSDKKITNTDVIELLKLISGSDSFSFMNLYTAEKVKLEQARDILADKYGLGDKKEQF